MKAEAIDLLSRMSLASKRNGDVRRARAYTNAARGIARTEAFETLVEAGRLQGIKGVGPSIERTLLAFFKEGKEPEWLAEADLRPLAPGELVGDLPATWESAPFRAAPDLHCHTTWSDGTLSLEELVIIAKHVGQPAVGVSDHSGSLRIARGLSPEEVRAQWAEVERVQADHPDILILRGTECDILRDGSLDHPDDILEGFDYVIGSLHSHLKLSEREQTERVVAALQNPHLDVFGHPTTRVPGHRPRANLDLERVFEAAAENRVALEVNANAGRIDLDVPLAREALEKGCRLSLGSDAHSAREMLAFVTAREMAAEAGASETDVYNLDFLGSSPPHRPKG